MKIAQVTPYDYKHPGGVSQHIRHLKAEFEELGHQVIVLAPRSSQGGLDIQSDFYGIGRPVNIPGNGSTSRLTFDITLYNAVKQILEREQFDVVHLHEPLIPLLPHMVLTNSKAVNVATFHAARETNPWYSALRVYFAFLMSRLDARICVSEPAKENVEQYFRGHYNVIPNGIDIEHFSPTVDPFEWAGDGIPRILFVGRYNEQRKGFKYLFRALPLIQQQFPETRLLVVGPGNPDSYLAQMERTGLEGVDFAGMATPADLARYYASCDVFCAPSVRGESFGLVLLEGMATAKPVVASNIPGYASVVTPGHDGLLTPAEDTAGLALAIVRILADARLRENLSLNGRATAETYAWPEIAARVLNVYERATATSRVR